MFEKLLNPGSVAVIGASPDKSKIGNAVIENLVNHGYRGEIFPVNPSYDEILGMKCYPDIGSVKGQVDVAVIALPAKVSLGVLEQCVRKKVGFAIIVAGGFSELGEEGRKLEQRLKDAIKGSATRIIGPNTVGVLFPNSGVNTALTPGDRIWFPGEGSVGFISQSGALGLLVMDSITESGMGVSGFVNIGNRADVNENDLIEMFLGDQKTKSIVLYLESFAKGGEFFELIKRANLVKPVVVLKTGRSPAASAAASFHTGAMASDDRVVEGVLQQAGVTRAYTEVELLDYGKALAYGKPLEGNRIAVITTAGGVGVVTTDILTSENRLPALSMAKFSEKETAELRKHVLAIASVANPIDLTADGSTDSYSALLEVLTASANVDGIIAYALPQTPKIDMSIVEPLKHASRIKTTVVGVVGNRLAKGLLRELESACVPAYPSIERTVLAMKVLYQYGSYRRRLSE